MVSVNKGGQIIHITSVGRILQGKFGAMNELGYKLSDEPIHLSLDNKAAIDSSYNPENHARTKHIDRRHYFIRELVEEGRLVVPFVSTVDNHADFFTKPLRPCRFFELRNKIMNYS